MDLRIAFCFPDIYEIGMSNLGMKILCGVLNEIDNVWCERVYSPWTDMEEQMRRRGIPLFTCDSETASAILTSWHSPFSMSCAIPPC